MKRIDLSDVDLLSFVGRQESQYITSFREFLGDITQRLQNGVQIFGDALPWKKTHDCFRLRPKEVTIWAGINGHGKSMVTSHVAASLSKDCKVLIASLEMPIAATGARMVRQIAGTSRPTEDFIRQVVDWSEDRIYLYDELDTVNSERILGLCIYAFTVLGIEHIFIDSLLKCGVPVDDYNRQKEFVDRLCWVAKTHGGHIHLIHHMRKSDSELKAPDKFDVKGAGEITDLVDNIVIVHRNKEKEIKVEKGEAVGANIPDATLGVKKQRHGEWEGKINLWFDKDSMQYKSGSDSRLEWFEVKKNEAA